jgi:hypothetical protein
VMCRVYFWPMTCQDASYSEGPLDNLSDGGIIVEADATSYDHGAAR